MTDYTYRILVDHGTYEEVIPVHNTFASNPVTRDDAARKIQQVRGTIAHRDLEATAKLQRCPIGDYEDVPDA